LIAGVKGLVGGAAFAEGHELDPERPAKVPAKQIGRMQTLPVSVACVRLSSVLAPPRLAVAGGGLPLLRGFAAPGVRQRRTPTPARRQCSATCGTLAHRWCAPRRRCSNALGNRPLYRPFLVTLLLLSR
jgi:hypothetical protein